MRTKRFIGVFLSLAMLIGCVSSVFAVQNFNTGVAAERKIILTARKNQADQTYPVIVYNTTREETAVVDSAKSDQFGMVTFEFALPETEEASWRNGNVYTAEIGGEKALVNGKDDYQFKLTFPTPTPTGTPKATKKPTGGGSGGGSSSGGTRGGSSVVIPGTQLSNNGVGEAVLNPNQYQKYGATAANITTSVTKQTANTFTVSVSINGTPVTMFTGYDAVMIKVPYSTSTSNPNNLVVYNQNGTIVPRCLYKDGYMYVRTNNIAGIFTIAENPVSFNDISNATHDWAMTGVNALAARTIINGVGNGNFEPNRAVTRAEFVKMIVSMFDVHNTAASSVFTDVSASDWYNTYVGTAQQLGITNGYEDGSFRPNDTISREEMSTMLYRAAEVLSVIIESANNAQNFEDDWNIQDYAKIPVYKMRSAGILNGVGNNMYDPKNDCTRAQSAVAIYNMFIVSMR